MNRLIGTGRTSVAARCGWQMIYWNITATNKQLSLKREEDEKEKTHTHRRCVSSRGLSRTRRDGFIRFCQHPDADHLLSAQIILKFSFFFLLGYGCVVFWTHLGHRLKIFFLKIIFFFKIFSFVVNYLMNFFMQIIRLVWINKLLNLRYQMAVISF